MDLPTARFPSRVKPLRPIRTRRDAGAAPAGDAALVQPDADTPPSPDAAAPGLDAAQAASWDPGFRMGTCGEWWMEVWASAASVAVEQEGGALIALAPWNTGSFATSEYLRTGTSIRLIATRADGAQARSAFFAYLVGSPSLEGSTPPPAADAGSEGADAGAPPSAIDAGAPVPVVTTALHTQGNRIYTADGQIWSGRGADIQDTRSCDACTWQAPSAAEVMRRVDMLADGWHADFMRMTLESYATSGGRVHWGGVLSDASYLADLKTIVDHIGQKPGVYVMLSLWIDPSLTSAGWPSATTGEEWRLLAETFADSPQVLFGLVNEPQSNYDGAQDALVWSLMNQTVQIIRDVEDQRGVAHHVVAVQGTGAWARRLDYYTTHPITAGGGSNVAYEVHVYDPASTFGDRFIQPSQTLPVIIGEFGPVDWAGMALGDCTTLIDDAERLQIPYLAWTFHQRCSPNLLVDYSSGGCGIGMPLQPTAWGQLLKDRLAR